MKLPARIIFTIGAIEKNESIIYQANQLDYFICKYNDEFNIINDINSGENLHYVYKKQVTVWVQNDCKTDLNEFLFKLYLKTKTLGFTSIYIAPLKLYLHALHNNSNYLSQVNDALIVCEPDQEFGLDWESLLLFLTANGTSLAIVGAPSVFISKGLLSSELLNSSNIRIFPKLQINLNTPDMLHINETGVFSTPQHHRHMHIAANSLAEYSMLNRANQS